MGSMPEPTWGTPTQTWQDDSALASMPLTGSLVTGLLLRLLESHFYDANNIKDAMLKAYLWKEDTPGSAAITSKVLIKPAEDYQPRDIEQRAAILVKRNEITSKKISIAGKAITHLEENGNYRGEDYYRLVSGSHIILCIADGSMAADRLANEVFYRLMEFTPSIKEDLKFTECEVSGLSPSEQLKEVGEKNYAIRIGFTWSHLHVWTLVPISPILKKVRVNNNPV